MADFWTFMGWLLFVCFLCSGTISNTILRLARIRAGLPETPPEVEIDDEEEEEFRPIFNKTEYFGWLFIHQQEDVQFLDIEELNNSIAETRFGELIDINDAEDNDDWEGFVRRNPESGLIEFAQFNDDSEFYGYGNVTQGGYYLTPNFFHSIAMSVKSGRLILRSVDSYGDVIFNDITAGQCVSRNVEGIKF